MKCEPIFIIASIFKLVQQSCPLISDGKCPKSRKTNEASEIGGQCVNEAMTSEMGQKNPKRNDGIRNWREASKCLMKASEFEQ